MSTEQHDQSVLAAIAPLREAGFALHWLHPRKKRPIGEEWQKAPVASLADLQRAHRPGNNLGVRLGEPSYTPAGYLHVFDLDIRVPDLAEEAWEAFESLFPGIRETLPCVESGSGGESRHLYFVTDRPFRSKKLAVSEGKHRRETRGDNGELKTTWSCDWEIELFGGSLETHKQVVLPPSIHPDTGQPYVWEREFDFSMLDLGIGPEIPSAQIEALGVAEMTTYAYESREPLTFKPGQMEKDLDAIDVSELDYDDWVRLGQALHHQFGGSQEGFDLWLAHTKRSRKFTGEKQIREMRRVKWRSFGKYRGQPVTMATIRTWAQDARAAALADQFDDMFDDEDDAEDADDDSDPTADLFGDDDPAADILGDGGPAASPAPAAHDPLSHDPGDKKTRDPLSEDPGADIHDWVHLLDRNEEGVLKNTQHNADLILANDPRLKGLAMTNEFTQETVQRVTPGTKAKKRRNSAKPTRQLTGRIWEVHDTLNGELWSDDRDFAIRSVIDAPTTQGGYGYKITLDHLRAAIVNAANMHAFHPVREYLEGSTWDGVQRVETLWIDYVNAPNDVYHRSVARMMMVAAVTRIYEPGHKFDFATILEGLQGKRKSTLISILGRSWFAELDGEFSDQKSMIELMQGAWIMEIPELTGFSRADVRAIKAFISRQKDRARLAYARRAGQFPRQCIFIGSTNDREYLKDDTGGRRFWPVECRLGVDDEIDTDRLEANIDQLWAEAVVMYRQMRAEKSHGTLPLYLADAEARATAARLQESRRQETPDDVLAGRIAEWLDRPVNNGGYDDEPGAGDRYLNEVCTAQIWVECLEKDLANFKAVEQGMVNRAMRRVPGWAPDAEATQRRFKVYGKQRVFYRGGEAGKLSRIGLEDLA
jgi:hypothetical protein